MAFKEFDRARLRLKPLDERRHELDLSMVISLDQAVPVRPHDAETFRTIANRIRLARKKGAPVVLMIGAHVLRSGVQRFLFDLIERGMITSIAMNGACAIHDYEFARIGATTESVAKYIRDGQFGMWKETGFINSIVAEGAARGLGFGEAVGKAIADGAFPHADMSLLARCYRADVLASVHVGLGYDIIHQHPDFDPAATGEVSYRDFLRFARVIEGLENGVVMNFGTAVMGPEIFLKALSMARNVASSEGRRISRFTSLVCDLHDIENCRKEPPREDPRYYFRPWKTLLARTVAGDGESYYVQGRHDETIPALWRAVAGKDLGRMDG